MHDLLPLLQQDGQISNGLEVARPSGDIHKTSPAQSSETFPSERRSSGNGAAWQDSHEPNSNGKENSKPGLFSKYLAKRQADNLKRAHRKSESREAQSLKDSNNLDDFSPLAGKMQSMNINQEHIPGVQNEPDSPDKLEKEPSLLVRMKGYKKKRKSMGKSVDFGSGGPLEEGAKTYRASADGTSAASRQNAHKAELNKFFELVSDVKALLAEVVQRQKQIEQKRAKMQTLIKPEEIQAAHQAIQEEVQSVTLLCKRCKFQLDEIDNLHAQNLDADRVAENDETLKLQLSVLSGLNQKASEVIKSWQKMQSRWASEDVRDVGQKLHTVTGRYYSEDEIEETLENGSPELIYRQALSENVSGATVQKVLKDVQQRHEQIKQLEASMLELHQVFLDMSILVAEQGHMIDNIENWVHSTAMTMQDSIIQLQAAKRHRRSAAQKKAATFVTGVGLVAGGAGLTATGVGAVAGVPMILAGVAAVGVSSIGGVT